MGDTRREKLKEIFEQTVESALQIGDNLDDLNYYSLRCRAANDDRLFKMYGSELCTFNGKYLNEDAIIMLFAIPINSSEETGARNVAERVMEVITESEKCLVTLDYVKTDEVKEEKFVYVLIVKRINGG
jgi:hypothetical protein